MGQLKKSLFFMDSLSELAYFGHNLITKIKQPVKTNPVERSINNSESKLRIKYVFIWYVRNLKMAFLGKAVPCMMALIDSNIDLILIGKRFCLYLSEYKSI